MIKPERELLVLGSCAVPGLVWVVMTDYFPRLGFQLDWLIDIFSLLAVASFSVRKMLPLRMLAVGSQAFAIPCFVLQSAPLWTRLAGLPCSW